MRQVPGGAAWASGPEPRAWALGAGILPLGAAPGPYERPKAGSWLVPFFLPAEIGGCELGFLVV